MTCRRVPVTQDVEFPVILWGVLRSRIRTLSVDDEQTARTVVRYLVGNAPEHKAPDPAHALVPDHHEVCLSSFRYLYEYVGWVPVSIVHLGGHAFAGSLGEHLRADVITLVMQQVCFRNSNASESNLRFRHGGGTNSMDDVQIGATHLGNGDGLSDRDGGSPRTICAHNNRPVHVTSMSNT